MFITNEPEREREREGRMAITIIGMKERERRIVQQVNTYNGLVAIDFSFAYHRVMRNGQELPTLNSTYFPLQKI